MRKLGVGALLAVAAAVGQSPPPPARPAFEVASVKPSGTVRGAGRSSAGHLVLDSVTLEQLIFYAYKVKNFQVQGGPAWINTQRYDIAAKAETALAFGQMTPMLQPLLEDRFKLAVHFETKELPVYALTAARGGLKLQVSGEGRCVKLTPGSAPIPPPAPGQPRVFPCGAQGYSPKELYGYGVPMRALIELLTNLTGRMVIDQTGFKADRIDFHLEYSADSSTPGVGIYNSPPSDATGPSIFTALQEKLGLKLESQKGPVEVLVIDHAEKPDAN